jgi:hypothetical protein
MALVGEDGMTVTEASRRLGLRRESVFWVIARDGVVMPERRTARLRVREVAELMLRMLPPDPAAARHAAELAAAS